MPSKLQIFIDVDLKSGDVKVNAPWDYSPAVVKALGVATQIAADTIAAQRQKATEELRRAKDGRTEAGLIVPNGVRA